ncbi:MAG TPA: acyltransferase [Hellea balneolensis]|uniref:Acyltransferase n=1 Tax=Hellea balneolensis TaxID=287478 RepID=A0A7C5R1H4_9PROT|nr:acyltransferase [Hellea balneolensis]
MTNTQGEIRGNRFDFLRLIFAGFVFAYHLLVLPALASPALQGMFARLAELSIQGFFIISGLLVYGSWQRSKTLALYVAKRVRRLYPAYVAVILIPAIFALLRGGALPEIIKYVLSNLAFLNFLHPTLPGMFETNPFPVVNGALWTLKIEVMFYMALPVMGWMLAKAGPYKWALMVLIYLAAEVWRYYFSHAEFIYSAQLARQLPGQMSFFITGMALRTLHAHLRDNLQITFVIAMGLLALSYLPMFGVMRAVGLGGLIFAIAYAPGPKLNAARFGDISYGLYITHFPIINGLVAIGVFANQPLQGYVWAVVLVVIASLTLWHLIEKPFLHPSSHYRQVGRHGRHKAGRQTNQDI